MGCTMGKAEKPAKKTGESSGNHSNQKVAKETTKTKADDTPVITADNANTVKSEPLKPNGDVTSDSNRILAKTMLRILLIKQVRFYTLFKGL